MSCKVQPFDDNLRRRLIVPRGDWESKLIRLQFDEWSEEIDEAFNKLLGAGETKDEIIQKLFSDYRESLRHVCVEGAITDEDEDRAAAGDLTNPDLVWIYLCRVHSFRERLASLSDQELAAAYRESWKKNHSAFASGAEAAGHRRDAFEFFNEPEADADYEFWLRVDAWTVEESVALSLGKNPNRVSSGTLLTGASRRSSPFRDEYRKRLFLLKRAQRADGSAETFQRDEVLQWLMENNIVVPPELSINKKDYDLGCWKTRCLELEKQFEQLSIVEAEDIWQSKGEPKRSTVYKVILGMALCAYAHRLNGSSPAPLSIEEDLRLLREQSADDLKLSVGDDKIRRILEKAEDLLSASWRGNLDFSVFAAWKHRNRSR